MLQRLDFKTIYKNYEQSTNTADKLSYALILWRYYYNYSHEKLSEISDVSVQAISDIEQRKRLCRLDTLDKIMRAFNMDIITFFTLPPFDILHKKIKDNLKYKGKYKRH